MLFAGWPRSNALSALWNLVLENHNEARKASAAKFKGMSALLFNREIAKQGTYSWTRSRLSKQGYFALASKPFRRLHLLLWNSFKTLPFKTGNHYTALFIDGFIGSRPKGCKDPAKGFIVVGIGLSDGTALLQPLLIRINRVRGLLL